MNGSAWTRMKWMEMNDMYDNEWKCLGMNELDGNE